MMKNLFILFTLAMFSHFAYSQCAVIYVSPTGTALGDGSEANPVDLQTGLAQACAQNRKDIRLLAGTYNLTSKMIVGCDDIIIDGDWEVVSGVGRKNSNLTTTVNIDAALQTAAYDGAAGTTVGFYIGVEAINRLNLRIEDITFNVKNGGAAGVASGTTGGRGNSVYGFYFRNSSGWILERCVMNTGAGTVGSNGVAGANGATGNAGGTGTSSDGCDGNLTNIPGGTGGAAIGAGVRLGGAGGAGGRGSAWDSSNNAAGTNGSNGGGGAAGATANGAAGANGTSCGSDCNRDGRAASNGAAGAPGTPGVASATSATFNFYWLTTGQSGSGTDGAGGGGGKGGGGGGRQSDDGCGFVCTCIDGPGSGGGGGGGGGEGGAFGTGGFGGGSSFALYCYGGTGTRSNTTLNAAAGALGGNGGAGGAGGAGGNAGLGGGGNNNNQTGGCSTTGGRVCGNTEVGAGGQGGFGGAGGAGGAGAAGAAGIGTGVQLVAGATSTVNTTAPITQIITNQPLEACTNSEIIITKNGGTWGLTGTGAYITDLNNTTSTYNNTSATGIVSYTSTGAQSIQINGVVYDGFIIINTNRPAPTFAGSMTPVVCEGDAFIMNTPTTGVQYEWVIFPAASTTASPLGIFTTSIASWTPPVVGSTQNYTVRLRVRENCCGWSRPVYYNFSVVSGAVGPVGTGATICENQTASISATGSGAGDLIWYSDPLGQNVLQTTTGATSTYVTLPMSQTGVFYVAEGVGGCPSSITAVQVTVNPSPVSPSSSNETFCAGQAVSLDASGTGGTLEWYTVPTGGVAAGTGATYNAGVLAAGNYTYYVAENNGTCSSQRTPVGATVYSLPASPTATATASCVGSPASLSAAGTGTINWYSDAALTNNVGVGSTYTTPPLAGSTTYYLTQTDGNGCQSTSANVVVSPTPGVTPSMSITASDVTICNGTTVNFTSTTNNGGAAPVYDWFINGVSQANNSSTFSYSSFSDGDVVAATLVSNAACASPSMVTSNSVVISVVSSVTPTVTAQAAASTICQGELGMFTAAITNGGSNPTYQWFLNGNPVGTNSNVYTNTGLATGDMISVDLTSSESCASIATVSSGTVTMTVNPSVTPSMAISASSNTICNGTMVNFTSTSNNAGTTPVYDWFINGVSQATNATTFSSSALANGDVISATLVSNAACASPTNATSNSVVMTVGTTVTPTVSAQASATSICAGDNVLFTAAITYGGTNPAYQWYLNGAPVGTNSNVYTNSTLANGDMITVQLTSSESCASTASVTSGAVTMTVNSSVNPSISISASTMSICSGAQVDFTASSANGGATPTYEWYVNGIAQSVNSTTFSSTTLNDGDAVGATMISSMSCATPTSSASNNIVISVSPSVTPAVAVNASTTAICAGETVTFSATPTNGGANPTYQWYLNGAPVGSNSQIYVNSTLVNGDQISVDLTSSEVCATTATVSSAVITMNTSNVVVPFAFISANDTELCAGDAVAVTSNITNGGSSPVYDWYLNGVSTGQTGSTFNSTALVGGDVLTLILTSSSACATPSITSSNSINFTTTSTTPAMVTLSTLSPTLCEGDNIIFVASANNAPTIMGYIWNLDGNVVGTSGSVYNGTMLMANSQIQVTLQYQDLCGNVNTATSNIITISPNPVVDAGLGGAIALGDSLQLNATTSIPGGYVWTPSASLSNASILNPYASPTETTTYVLTAVTDMGCKTTDSVTVIVSDGSNFDIVNSFTPNGDGTNDTWVIHNLELYPNFTIAIYNRWGLLLYDQSGTYTPWDGTYKGNVLPSDTYFYVLQLDSTLDPINGSVTIVR